MKNHLKRAVSPKTWIINRKENKFTIRPNPGAHALANGLPLGIVLRDKLNLASTTGEIKKILNNQEILVDGKRRKNHRLIVGLFDVVSIPLISKNYRLLVDTKGRLILIEISAEESKIKLSKVVGKTVLRGGKIQFNLHDGKNILTDKEAKIGDSFVLSLPKIEIKKILPFKEGAYVFLTKGKHAGDTGVLKTVKGAEATYSARNTNIDTAKEYFFVVGENKAEINLGKTLEE